MDGSRQLQKLHLHISPGRWQVRMQQPDAGLGRMRKDQNTKRDTLMATHGSNLVARFEWSPGSGGCSFLSELQFRFVSISVASNPECGEQELEGASAWPGAAATHPSHLTTSAAGMSPVHLTGRCRPSGPRQLTQSTRGGVHGPYPA